MRVLALCLLLVACASPALPTGPGARLLAGAAEAPPLGLVGYCEREPGDCAAMTDGADQLRPLTELRGREEATGAASLRPASSAAGDPSMLFHALMSSREAQASPPKAADRVEATLDERSWREIVEVNRLVNRAIAPATDEANYGVEEYWTRPLALNPIGARGDCEDYALEKRAQLVARGWPPAALALAVAVAPGVGLHAILIVQTDRGDFVLDNLYDNPRALNELDYVWLSRQADAVVTHWASATPSSGASARAWAAAETPEARFNRLMRERTSSSRTALQVADLRLQTIAYAAEPVSFAQLTPFADFWRPAPRPAPSRDLAVFERVGVFSTQRLGALSIWGRKGAEYESE